MKYANHIMYSDITPYEVIKENTARKLTIRSMICDRVDMGQLRFVVGGFSAVCVNQNEQKWDIKSNPDGYTTTIRLNIRGEWKDPNGNKYSISDRPVKFYDYNF